MFTSYLLAHLLLGPRARADTRNGRAASPGPPAVGVVESVAPPRDAGNGNIQVSIRNVITFPGY
jgi:hypothetical protein